MPIYSFKNFLLFSYMMIFLITNYSPQKAFAENVNNLPIEPLNIAPIEKLQAEPPENSPSVSSEALNTPQDPLSDYGVAMHGLPNLKSADDHLPYTNPNAPKGGHLKQAVSGSFDNLNPYNIKGIAAKGLNLIYDRLTIRSWDEPFTLYPLIAEKVTFSPDRLSIDIRINPLARFSDGSAITSDDIVFTIKTLQQSGRPNMRRMYALIDDIKVSDKYNVTIKLSDQSNRETAMIVAMMPVLSKAYWNNRDFTKSQTEPPVSNGPYEVKSFEIGRKITYQRNKDYWAKDLPIVQGLNNFDQVTYEYFRDDSIALMAFNSGDIDYRREFDISKWQRGYNEEQINKGTIKRQEIKHGRTDKAHSLIFNMRRAPFDNLAVRKALSSVVDFNWINQNIYYGKKKRQISFFPNSDFSAIGAASESEIELLGEYSTKLPKDTTRSAIIPADMSNKQTSRKTYKIADYMLRNAGLDVVEGQRVNASTGEAFTFEIIVRSEEDEKLALAFKRSLKRLGIVPSIRRLDSTSFQSRLSQYDYDMAIYHWSTSLSPGTEQYLYWSCESKETQNQWNYAGICESGLDYLIGSLANTRTREDLIRHMKLIDRILTHSYIAIPLFYSNKDYVAYNSKLEHSGKHPLYGVVIESWWEKQRN